MTLKPGSKILLTAALVSFSTHLSGAATVAYDHGNPTDAEQYMLELINRARANPAAEGERLANAGATDPQIRAAYNFFNVDLGVLRSEFASYPARPPVVWNKALLQSSYDHSSYLISIDQQTHARPPGMDMRDSFTQAGYSPYSGIAENIFAYSENVWYSHVGLNSDWGRDEYGNPTPDGVQPHRGHRKTLMSYEDGPPMLEIGIAIIPENNPNTQVGPLVVTQHFGYTFNASYVGGVVYNDDNGDGFYTPGEGVGGVQITPSVGNWHAVTSTSGGYTIPMDDYSGPVTFTVTGGGLAEPMQITLILTPENRKLDIVDHEFVDGGAFGGYWDYDFGGDDGWSRSSWMGWINEDPSGWVGHATFGWIYPFKSGSSATHLPLYDFQLGWLWTARDFYPHLYSYGFGTWLYYAEPSMYPDRWFYRYDTEQWLQESAF